MSAIIADAVRGDDVDGDIAAALRTRNQVLGREYEFVICRHLGRRPQHRLTAPKAQAGLARKGAIAEQLQIFAHSQSIASLSWHGNTNSPRFEIAVVCAMVVGPKPPVTLSFYNRQDLPPAQEFARRRFQAFERSTRADAEALQALRSGRTQEQRGQEQSCPGESGTRRGK